MAVATPAAALAMTEQQRRDFDEHGFILLENFFTPAEFERLLAAIDEVAAQGPARRRDSAAKTRSRCATR